MVQTSKKVRFSKIQQMAAEERQRAISNNPALLSQLTPTEIALLFPDYFKRGKPDVGGFREAISQETARKQATWEKNIDERVGKQGGWLERMRQQYGSTASGGNLKQNQQEAYKAARAEGLSDSAAKILVANMSGESLKNPGDHHWDRSHMSQGIVQWDPDRAERIKNKYGAYPKDMSVADQTKAAIWEMKTYYGKSYSALTNDGMSPQDRLNMVVSDYERPQDVSGSVYTRMGYYNGLKIDDSDVKSGDVTPSRGGSQTTPGSGGTGQATGGMSFNVKSGYIVPKDNNLYDTRNAQQCATLGKAFNPSVGRSSGWNIVDGQIKAGQVVATKQYNNGGSDKVGAGYHTGVAMTSPNEKGDFLLLEQYNNSGGAKLRWVNQHSYPAGNTGNTTSWGLISSNGKVHDEISQEALSYGQTLATPEQRQSIGSNSGAPGAGGEAAPGVAGEVSQGPMGGSTFGQGDQQSATLMQPMSMAQNLMGMAQNGPMGMMGMMGAMGGMGMQSATPLGLITTAMGFIMPLIGSLAGERLSGEGMGDAGHRRHRRGHGHHHRHTHITQMGPRSTTKGVPAAPVDNTPIKHREDLGLASIKYEGGGKGVDAISSGRMSKKRKDPGGISYGEHQISTPTMKNYLKSEQAKPYADKFAGLTPGTPAFNKVYKQVAKEDPKGFSKSHQDFITKTHYEPVYRHAKSLGYNINDPRVQEALYSISVQHAGANKIVSMASAARGTTPESQIEALYGSRRQYAATKGMNFDTRYKSEKSDILAMDVSKYNTGTQFASASPMATTGAVGPTPATPGAAAGPNTRMAAAPMSTGEKILSAVVGSKTSTAAPVAAVTPRSQTPLTPTTTTPLPQNVMYQFGQGKDMSATVAPQTNVPATPASPVLVRGVQGALPAPGPAPDATSVQMGQVRNEIAAVAAQQQSTQTMTQQRPMEQGSTQGFNPDLGMKQIAQPYNTPSFHRAVTRSFGSDTPGEVGQNHFNYGNAR